MRRFKKIAPIALAPLMGLSPQNGAVAGERPNIILFMVDDMGWQDTSYPFWREKTALNERYHTPNMERMAAQGMAFTQSRAALARPPALA